MNNSPSNTSMAGSTTRGLVEGLNGNGNHHLESNQGASAVHASTQKQEPPAASTQDGPGIANAWLEALRLLEKEQAIDFNLNARQETLRFPEAIPDLCAKAGLRHRKVVLNDDWWESDCGTMLAFQSGGAGNLETPVVLIRRGRRYRLYLPGGKKFIAVDARGASGLQREAYVFYRPLPERSLRFPDLFRFGAYGRLGDMAVLLGATISTGLLALLTPMVTRRIVNFSIPRANSNDLVQLAAALVVGAIAAGLFELVRSLTLLRLKCISSISLQAALWDRLLTLPISFFRKFSTGDLALRAMGINRLQHLLTADITSAAFGLLSALTSLTILCFYSPRLGFLAVVSAAMIACLTTVIARLQLRHFRELQKLDGKLSALVYGLLKGISKLRVAGAEQRAFAMWAERFGRHRQQSITVRRLSNMQSALGAFYGFAMPIAFVAMVGLSRKSGMGTGDFLAFSAAFAQFQAAAIVAISIIPVVLTFVPTYERMEPVLSTLPEATTQKFDPGPLKGEIELRNVTFRYNDGPPVLHDVSLRVRPGELVAIVGPSGSGKSTLLRLILGFGQPEAGLVLIDQHDVSTLNMALVRRGFGVVLQNAGSMAGDIFHNIVGSLPLTMEDAWRAARLVGLDEEIRAMPMNMFTFVNRETSFSGGQRQRLMLARAIVGNPRILLLDEATSALDNRTQELVTRNLRAMGATRIVVAHRLSTVQDADCIYVLESGRIVEQGTYNELMTRGGAFVRMTERQRVTT